MFRFLKLLLIFSIAFSLVGFSYLPHRRKAFRTSSTDTNYWGTGADGSVTISSNTTWDSTDSGDMMVKHLNNLTVNSGYTLTIKVRKGALIFVKGNLSVSGTIKVVSGYSADPSTEGVDSGGLDIYLNQSGGSSSGTTDLTGCGTTAEALSFPSVTSGYYLNIPRTGGSGGAADGPGGTANGNPGGTLSNAPGGGGSGGHSGGTSGAGGAATCWSGGAGGGGAWDDTGGTGSSTGGTGGAGASASYNCGGGAGNPGGSGSNTGSAGTSEIGGMALFFVRGDATLNSGSYIKADGGDGGDYAAAYGSGGGGSGGGVIGLFYAGTLTNNGTIQASGGAAGAGYTGSDGGTGGAGSTVTQEIDL